MDNTWNEQERLKDQETAAGEFAFYAKNAEYLGFTLTEEQVRDLVSMDRKFELAGFPGFLDAFRRIMTRRDPDELRISLVGILGEQFEVIAESKNPLARLIDRLRGRRHE